MTDFYSAIQQAGLNPPDYIEPGKAHRFPGTGKDNDNRAGWCRLFEDQEGGIFGDWSTGFEEVWHATKERPLSATEQQRRHKQIETARNQAAVERQQAQLDATARAAEIWNKATPAPKEHCYLARKSVKPFGIRVSGTALVIQLRDGQGNLCSLQFIESNGHKRFLSGGRVTGCYFSLGRPEGVIVIAEGYATAATIHEATGHAVVVAFNAGNLQAVAEAIRAKFPDIKIIVAGDNDENNTGQIKAKEAAAAVAGSVSIPPEVGDWNDIAAKQGLNAIADSLLSALSVPQVSVSRKKVLPELPAVAAFDFALLPENLQVWAKDIVGRIQCPADYVAVTVMAGLGAVIGRKLAIRPQEKTDWEEYPNQWALVIGRPGVLKSPAMEQALKPLKKLVANATQAYQEEIASYGAASRVEELKAEAAEKEARARLKKNPAEDVSGILTVDQQQEPTLKRYIANDTSGASLGELLRLSPNGLLVYRDEIVSLLKTLDREDSADTRGFYLTGWNGNSAYTFDRIGRGLNLHIPAVCLSMLGSTQPGRVSEYLKQAVNGGPGDDGLIQRFGLLVWPDISTDWRDVDAWPDTNAKNKAFEVFSYLDTLQPATMGAEYDEFAETYFLRFSSAALEEFRQWREQWERKLRSGDLHPALESHLAKYRKLIPSLALIIHLADKGTGPVSLSALGRALAWGEYLETHAIRAYSSVTMPEVGAAKAILRRIEKGDIKEVFTARDIYRNSWAHLSDSKRVHAALSLLSEYGHLQESRSETEGRTTTLYRVIP